MLRLSGALRSMVRSAVLRSDDAAGGVPKKLKLNFSAPHEVFASNLSVDAVYVPSREGVLGIMPGTHVDYAV
jgi:hypothetical protein